MEPVIDINHIPALPVISRFVAPWDTSGWYCVRPNFSIGKRLYSNSDVYVAQVPEQYCGWEYIMTFDSKKQGFDDKQEVEFYVEQNTKVVIALDQSAPDHFLSGFTDTNDTMSASDGTIYRFLSAYYPQGTHVHIPGFTGDFHHFIVLAFPSEVQHEGDSFETLSVPCTLSPYPKRNYTWYFHEVFNQMPAGTVPAGFSCGGSCQIMNYPYSIQRNYVSLRNGAFMKKNIPASGHEILELSVQVLAGALHIQFCNAEVILGNNCVSLKNGEAIAFSNDNHFDLRFIRDVSSSPFHKNCSIWVNNRLTGQTDCDSENMVHISISAGKMAITALDFISLRDNTEIFVVQEDFDSVPSNLICNSHGAVILSDYPFDTNRSLCLTDSCFSYPFSPVTDTVTIETKVKAEKEGFVILPELRDKNGLLALRIAMYHNNLYVSKGHVWERVFSGDADWMYYPSGNWYNIRITVFLSDSTYDVYVDGAKRVHHFPLVHPVKSIAQACYFVHHGKLYINELRIYDAATICRGLMPPNMVFDIKKSPYNACGDGITLDTQVLQRAIDDAAYTGGTVYLHDGTFFTGSLNLHGDMTFFIDHSAILIGTQDHTKYPLHTPGNSLCASRQLGRGLLYGQNLSHIRITGGGTIDGQGLYRFKMNDPSNNRLPDSRPCMIYLSYSSSISLEDIRFRNSAYWTVVPLSCRNVLMQYLDLDCMNTPNRDGIDPVDCRDMTIRRCNIMAGDDGLCFKSSDAFGCENIDVADIMIQSLASGIKFGTDTYYSLKSAYFRNCVVKNVNRCGISLETVDGAEISDVIFDEIDMTDVGAPVYITIGNRQRVPRNIPLKRQGSINGVLFKHLRFDKAYPFSFTKDIHETMIIGQGTESPVCNISFQDCYFELPGGFSEIPGIPKPINQKYPEYDQHGLSNGHAFCIRFARNVQFHNCKVVLKRPDVRPMIGLSDYDN